ncbi:MAG: bifunctional adenosylcobinamide kinase/adenosylcobinamide-phosphate guanylyltransferase [Bacillota bacterium]|nr:bifunctional adenosylcobinamide kinase/adenosylcobinamide-phosphate guanylyltransferase [Bacillota bacterium]
MSDITLITGGARSGKSSFGEKLLKESNGIKGYIATAVAFDEGMKDRIKKHQNSRPSIWKTYELPVNISNSIKTISNECDIVILDCITVFISNIIFEDNLDWKNLIFEEIDLIEKKIIDEINNIIIEARKNDLDMIIITNEIGSGIVPDNKLSRVYRDIAGRVNQLLSKLSDNVYLSVSGLELKLK